MIGDVISHEFVELTPLNGVRRRLDPCCLTVLHGDGDCRIEPVTAAEAAQLAGEESRSPS